MGNGKLVRGDLEILWENWGFFVFGVEIERRQVQTNGRDLIVWLSWVKAIALCQMHVNVENVIFLRLKDVWAEKLQLGRGPFSSLCHIV